MNGRPQVNGPRWSPALECLRGLLRSATVGSRRSVGTRGPSGIPPLDPAVDHVLLDDLDNTCARGDEGLNLDLHLFPAVNTGGKVSFYSMAFRISYRYPKEGGKGWGRGCVVYRLNIPRYSEFSAAEEGVPAEYSDHSGIVVFVGATASIGVEAIANVTDGLGGSDAEAASALASGMDVEFDNAPFGRAGFPMATVTYNNPGFGEGAYQSSGNPLFKGSTARNENGDDYCGPMQAAAMDAVIAHAMEIFTLVAAVSAPRLLITSFSNGATCASGWMARYADPEVHAFVEMEGPTDGEEQLVCAECYDPLDQFNNSAACPAPVIGGITTLSVSGWLVCTSLPGACRGQAKFQPAWERYYRPPPALVKGVETRVALSRALGLSGNDVHPYPGAVVSIPYDAGTLPGVEDFFAERTASVNLRRRRGGYVRINGEVDHVQPGHYYNRHAWRALLAAQFVRTCRPGESADDVYYADASGYFSAAIDSDPPTRQASAPTAFNADFDPDVYNLVPWTVWPALGGRRWPLQVDLVRWSFSHRFETSCS